MKFTSELRLLLWRLNFVSSWISVQLIVHRSIITFTFASPLIRLPEFPCHFLLFTSRTVQLRVITWVQEATGYLPRVCCLDNYLKVIIGFTSSWHRAFCSFPRQYGAQPNDFRSISVFQLTPSVPWFYLSGKKKPSNQYDSSLSGRVYSAIVKRHCFSTQKIYVLLAKIKNIPTQRC